MKFEISIHLTRMIEYVPSDYQEEFTIEDALKYELEAALEAVDLSMFTIINSAASTYAHVTVPEGNKGYYVPFTPEDAILGNSP
jgi:hypothetical protein